MSKFKRFLKRMIYGPDTHPQWRKRWKKIVKQDADWDYDYLDTLVKHKLELMYEYYSKSENVVQAEESRLEIVSQIKEVLDLFDKIENYDYEKEAMDFAYAHCKRIVEQDDKYGLVTRGEWDSEENSAKWKEMVEAAWQEELNDTITAYSLIGKNKFKWWD